MIASTTPTPTDEDLFSRNVKDVFFDYDKYAIRTADAPTVQNNQSFLAQHPNIKVLVEGHCDERGTTEYNLGLGDRRANAVKKFLQSLGVDEKRLETLSKGSTDAKQSGGEAEWSKDRRVDFIILKK